jgi:hypothetical protein
VEVERIKGFTKNVTCYAIRAEWLKKPAKVKRAEETEDDAEDET